MSTLPSQLFESALSLPQSERADLAFQLLQSLDLPGQEITSEEFADELHQRIEADSRGELQSFSLAENRAIILQRLRERRQ